MRALLELRRFSIKCAGSCRASLRCASSAERLESRLQAALQQQAAAAGVGLFLPGCMEMSRCCGSPINIGHFPLFTARLNTFVAYAARSLYCLIGCCSPLRRGNTKSHASVSSSSLSLRSRGRAKLSPNRALMKQTYLPPETPLLIISPSDN